MTRRTVIGATLAAAPGTVIAAAVPAVSDARPPLYLKPLADGRWRYRCWQWREHAWRPRTGTVTVDLHGAITLDTQLGPHDLTALHAALGKIVRERTGNSAR